MVKKTIKFITGNKNKLKEAEEIIGNVEGISINLDEIQELDSRKIIEHKLKGARKYYDGELFCEDISFAIKSLNGFPGPLIKWYLHCLNPNGIYEFSKNHNDKSVIITCCIGYSNGENISYFESSIEGNIVEPQGKNGFGFDSIFMPKDSDKTFAQMSFEEKNLISHRKKSLEKLKNYLNSSGK